MGRSWGRRRNGSVKVRSKDRNMDDKVINVSDNNISREKAIIVTLIVIV